MQKEYELSAREAAADAEREAREREEIAEQDLQEFEARMEHFDAGLCSFRAAVHGGDEYAMEMRESAELARTVAAPIAAALSGWMRSQRRAA